MLANSLKCGANVRTNQGLGPDILALSAHAHPYSSSQSKAEHDKDENDGDSINENKILVSIQI
ncbi:MAG: hypothetical protein DMG05_10400 [Acidobacteria bacterium]|nr:MAG: hypothetical protein DMG05_10400 [Acidobacteriota bacterium]